MSALSTPTKPKRRAPGDVDNARFWAMAHKQSTLTERERISRIISGFESQWLVVLKAAFNLTVPNIADLISMSPATVERRIKEQSVLNSVTSERLDRIAQIAVLAADVFEDDDVASNWLASPNDLLAGATPLSLCETELGARQVRRILHAIEWGNVA